MCLKDDYSIIVNEAKLRNLVYRSYFRMDITTKFAVDLLQCEMVDFVKDYEEWLDDSSDK